MSSLLQQYRTKTIPHLKEKFGIDNVMAVPKLEKVIINVGIGKFAIAKDNKFIEKIVHDLGLLTGQKPIFKKSKKSISGFKIREGMNIGLMVTLRGKRMYDFIERLSKIALPRSKDFRGIDLNNFDKEGNLNIGLKEHSIFPEIHYESIKDIFGLQITFKTTAKNKEQGIELLRELGMPLRKKEK